jgi:DNA-binding SARP family transcriptional activator
MPGKNRYENSALLCITLLGRFSVRDSRRSEPVRVPTRVQQLLAYLLLHPRREFRRAHLAEVLWGTRRQAESRKRLRQALWGLRAGIQEILPGRELLRCQGEWVRVIIEGPIRIDAHLFEDGTSFASPRLAVPLAEDQARSLCETVDLYQGDLLEGWDQEWCVAPREHLRRRFLGAVELLMNHFEAMGDDARAMSCAARALELDPARESAHRAVIRMLARTGDRSGAIRQYRACEAAVQEELGAPPDEATKALYEEILGGGTDHRG